NPPFLPSEALSFARPPRPPGLMAVPPASGALAPRAESGTSGSAPAASATPTGALPSGTVLARVPRRFSVGYAYPTVWLLPLIMALLVALLGRELTRDLTPRRP
ncbi:MAG: hypothetical protein ACYDAD_03125, partial [Acidimicrobiales bacterium]